MTAISAISVALIATGRAIARSVSDMTSSWKDSEGVRAPDPSPGPGRVSDRRVMLPAKDLVGQRRAVAAVAWAADEFRFLATDRGARGPAQHRHHPAAEPDSGGARHPGQHQPEPARQDQDDANDLQVQPAW